MAIDCDEPRSVGLACIVEVISARHQARFDIGVGGCAAEPMHWGTRAITANSVESNPCAALRVVAVGMSSDGGCIQGRHVVRRSTVDETGVTRIAWMTSPTS